MIGEMIKAARKERHLSQEELALKLGINRATLSKYEGNFIEPSSSMLIQISKELKFPVSFFFGESTGQVLSFDLQSSILSTIQERLSFFLGSFDPEDLYAGFGTHNVSELYRDIFYPKTPITLARVEAIADELGITTEYLLGVVDEPSDTVESIRDHNLLWRVIDTMSALNDSGQERAVERIEELAEIPRFQKGLKITPVRGSENKFDVWQDAAEAPDEPFSSAFTIRTDLSLEEAKKFVGAYDPEKEKPPQDQEDPETEKTEE